MNGKKANWAFLITILCYIGLIYFIAVFFPSLGDNLFWSNLLCELVVMMPVFILALASKERLVSFLGFHRMKISSVLMTVLFTFLSMPALTLFNLISQIWVENEVAVMLENQQAAGMQFGVLYLSMGVIAPVFEETACRGAYYRAYKKSGSAFKAMLLSALIFALVHMNFNQAAYAFVMGILAVLLVEATGSLWPAILYHGLINGSQFVLMYWVLSTNPEIYSEQAAMITPDYMLIMIAVYLILTAVMLPLAWAVLVWISANEGRSGVLSRIWTGRKEKKDKMITVPFLIAVILCIGIMTGVLFLLVMKVISLLGIGWY